MISSQEDGGAVVEQLEQLRRNYKNLKVLLVVLWLLFILFLVKLQLSTSPQIVTAETFLMQDAQGTTRAGWGVLGESAFLHLNDAKGKPLITLSANPSGPSLALYDGESSKLRALLTTKATGTSLSLVDAGGKPRAVLKVAAQPEEAPTGEQYQEVALILYDKDGHALFKVP